ncbi:cryptochrome/photolyase family protein [Siphonobacter aquaeclarae]|uniref:Deoxyribodipyrimidine photo-lyase n=1 Tax=Siphonobacter aquaeclarae TaxID=563176 RepID=A0A1G9V9B3_9BACT|nr:deoxyribodipyrimidine photo-lyase [Siphonobacter aquaeclarae]SDM68782.1 deoxyribodipyrimidine photo-lyase [Siphonobacter aquaeclarae]
MSEKIAVCWFRRDLRLHDQAALYYALKSGYRVLPLFIFDREILDKLSDPRDLRVTFIHREIRRLREELASLGSSIRVEYGAPVDVWKKLLHEYDIAEVYTNHDYEPAAVDRDDAVGKFLNANRKAFYTFKDQCIFEKKEVLSQSGTPYTVFTPYSRAWKATLTDFYTRSYPTETYFDAFFQTPPLPLISLEEMGFEDTPAFAFPERSWSSERIRHYAETRDFPGMEGTTRLSVHLRFGTISIRDLVRDALAYNATYLNELIWRDFYFQILHHFPHVGKGLSFRPEYDRIRWRNKEAEFEAWCDGRTGYPLVDAGMRELNATGYMHNRVRMVTASFLAKHLLVDWRWGEAYFAKKLLDYDLAANNGGWQWAAGSGCDAAPYFRVFNPALQAQKFDPHRRYIRKWVPEADAFGYPPPVVEHAFARERAIQTYQAALKA